MNNQERLQYLRLLFYDISEVLTRELAKPFPDPYVLLESRKELKRIDNNIHRLQRRQGQ